MARKSREQKSDHTRVVGYVRVSSEHQVDQGVSLQAQEEKIRQYCALYDLTLVDIVIDAAVSAKSLQREGLQKALSMLTSGQADGVVVVKLDRLTRNVADLGSLITEYFNSYALLSVCEQIDTRSASGRLVLNVLTSVAQWEREAIGERTSQALQYKKSQGERVGTVSMGKCLNSDGKSLVDNTQEQQAKYLTKSNFLFFLLRSHKLPGEGYEKTYGQVLITRAKQYRESGLSLRKIATKLAEHNYFNRLGSMYNARSIAIMVGEA